MEYPKCTISKEICSFRNKNGYCTLGITCQKIVEQCEGCNKVENGYCRAYINPENKWKYGRECPLASHLEKKKLEYAKTRVGQQKQKKKTNK
jgi:hypothetical protein